MDSDILERKVEQSLNLKIYNFQVNGGNLEDSSTGTSDERKNEKIDRTSGFRPAPSLSKKIFQ